MADKKPYVLDLSTVEPARPLIRIDGQTYELALVSDFGLVQRARLQRLQKQVQDLARDQADRDDVSEDDAQALIDALDRVVQLVVREMPADLLKRLDEGQKVAIVEAFSKATGMKSPGTAPAPSPKSTGARLSRGSKGSTGAVVASG